MVTRDGDFTLGATPMAKYYVGGKKHLFSQSKMKVHFRAPLTHFLKSIMRDAGETYTFATESHFAPPGSALEKNASDIMLLLCGDYAGISDADLSFLRDPGLCGEHPHAISNILCTGVDDFCLLLCGVEAKRTPPVVRAHDNILAALCLLTLF